VKYVWSGKFVGLRTPDWRKINPQAKEDLWAALIINFFTNLQQKFYIMPDALMNEIKRIAIIDFGHKRKNFKYRVKKAINIQANNIRKRIVEMTLNITEFDAEDMEISIDPWLTSEDKVIISINVIFLKYVCL
jgi:hypothetical protein